MKLKVKVCCISSIEEANTAVKYGATALGLVSRMPSGPGVIDDETISGIVKIIPDKIESFLLTSETSAEKIISQHEKFKTNAVQIVDKIDFKEFKILREYLPQTLLVQVVHVTDESSVDFAKEASGYADMLLLDSGNPGLAVKELGGTGRVHNWMLSRLICESAGIPVYLAGGLNAGNVSEAVEKVKPFGVDLCSGVRTNNMLDENKLSGFFNEIYKINLNYE